MKMKKIFFTQFWFTDLYYNYHVLNVCTTRVYGLVVEYLVAIEEA